MKDLICAVGDEKFYARDGGVAVRDEFVDRQRLLRRVEKRQRLMVARVHHDGLAAAVRVDGVALNRRRFIDDHSAVNAGQIDLAPRIGEIPAVAGNLAVRGVYRRTVRVSNEKLHAAERFTCCAVELANGQGAFGRIPKNERLCISRIDYDSLRDIVENVAIRGFGFGHDIGAGIELFQDDLPVAVYRIDSIGAGQALVVRRQLAVRHGNLELCAGQRFAGGAVELLDDQRPFRRVPKFQRDRFVGLDLRRLCGIVEDVARSRARFFRHNGLARFQIRNQDAARVVRRVISVAGACHSAVAVGDEKTPHWQAARR